MTGSLLLTTQQLQVEFQRLINKRHRASTRSVTASTRSSWRSPTKCQQKLDQNIKEGFAQFEKVQQHLKNAEEQLREVGVLGNSITT